MNKQKLNNTVQALLKRDKGLLAMDESKTADSRKMETLMKHHI